MEITGKIIQVLDIKQGVSKKGSPWMSQEYVIETLGQYPKKCCFRVFGQDKIEKYGIMLGEVLTVSIDIDCREYQGKWYNDISAWNVTRGAVQAPQAAQPQPQPQPTPPPATAAPPQRDDELPF